MLCGTGHVVYTMLPIIYDVAIKNGIRPERPMAAVVDRKPDGHHREPGVRRGRLAGRLPRQGAGRRPGDRLRHAAVGDDSRRRSSGVLMIGIFSWFRGKDLDKDEDLPEADRRPGEAQVRVRRSDDAARTRSSRRDQWTAMWIFVGAIAVVALLGAVRADAAGGRRQADVDGADDPDVHADGRRPDHRLHQDQPGGRSARTRCSAPA